MTVLKGEQGSCDLSVPADVSEHALADHAWKGDGSGDVQRRIAAASASQLPAAIRSWSAWSSPAV
jgi:hypothetical protein